VGSFDRCIEDTSSVDAGLLQGRREGRYSAVLSPFTQANGIQANGIQAHLRPNHRKNSDFDQGFYLVAAGT
jgi:hypothetical protein